jgi:pimeloyl-ACP methyl ester carboxylesterase
MFWIGKSMGGMISYVYGQKPESYRTIKGVITLGSPAIFEYKNPLLEFISRIAPRNISVPINLSELLQKLPEISESFKKIGSESGNIETDIFDMYLKHGMNTLISSKVFSHFSVFFRHNTFCSYPSYPWLFDLFGYGYFSKFFIKYDYKKNLNRFRHPLLAIAGDADKEAPLEDVKETVKRVGSIDKNYYLFAKKNGYKMDYGHLDLNLGKYAKEEVYPVIADWIYQH